MDTDLSDVFEQRKNIEIEQDEKKQLEANESAIVSEELFNEWKCQIEKWFENNIETIKNDIFQGNNKNYRLELRASTKTEDRRVFGNIHKKLYDCEAVAFNNLQDFVATTQIGKYYELPTTCTYKVCTGHINGSLLYAVVVYITKK